jgi:hypothetical protein
MDPSLEESHSRHEIESRPFGGNLMRKWRMLGGVIALLLFAVQAQAASSDVADAVMRGNKDLLRSLLQKKVDVNAPQIDGTTALHWARSRRRSGNGRRAFARGRQGLGKQSPKVLRRCSSRLSTVALP